MSYRVFWTAGGGFGATVWARFMAAYNRAAIIKTRAAMIANGLMRTPVTIPSWMQKLRAGAQDCTKTSETLEAPSGLEPEPQV